jgi:hypothetical protein
VNRRQAATILAGVLGLSAALPATASASGPVIPPPLVLPVPLPGTPLYALNQLWQRLEIDLAFNPAMKAGFYAQFAEDEASLAAQLAARGDVAEARQALKAYVEDVRLAARFNGRGPDRTNGLLSQAVADGTLLNAYLGASGHLRQAGLQAMRAAIRSAQASVSVQQAEGIVAAPAAIVSSTAPPPPFGGNGLLNAVGSGTTPPSGGLSLSLVGRTNAILVGNPVWVLMRRQIYTGTLEPGQRVHVVMVNQLAVLIIVQTPTTWARFEGYSAAGTSGLASLTLTEPFMPSGSTFTVPLAAGAVARAGHRTVDWSAIQVGTRMLVTYNTMGEITAARLTGKDAGHGHGHGHGPGRPHGRGPGHHAGRPGDGPGGHGPHGGGKHGGHHH